MSQRIRILHIFKVMNRGGAESLILNIMRKINRDIYQFDFLVHTKIEGHFEKEILSLGGEIHRINKSPKNIFQYRKEFKKVLEEKGPYDVIHSHIYSYSGFILKIASDLDIPVRIAHSHTTQDGKKNSFPRKIYRIYTKRLILDHATHLLGCSNDSCTSLFGKNCFKDSRVEVFENGIDPDLYDDSTEKQLNLKQELLLKEDSKIIGHVGSFTHSKNHLFLLKVFKELYTQDESYHLLLVGDGPLREEINEQINYKGLGNNVHMLGIREDIPNVMKNLDLFLFPSLFEGLGIVVIEAQAAGVKCVISDTIPNEVDLELDLIYFMSLQKEKEAWVEVIMDNINTEKKNWAQIKNKINKKGYNIKNQCTIITEIYSSIDRK